MRESIDRASTDILLTLSLSWATLLSLPPSFMRQPSTMFEFAVSSSRTVVSSWSISAMRPRLSSMLCCTPRTRFSCSAMSPSMRSMLSLLLFTSARSTAAMLSH